jgi:hypothetical protein
MLGFKKLMFVGSLFLASIAVCLVIAGSFRGSAAYTENMFPEYELINRFSEKIKDQTGLSLYLYAINQGLPKGYEHKNKVANIHVDFCLYKNRNESVTLEEARTLLVSVCEALMNEMNSDPVVSQRLDDCPATSKNIILSLFFKDENTVPLGSGISHVYFFRGRVIYKQTEIIEYRMAGRSSIYKSEVLSETYEEARDTVIKNGSLISSSALFGEGDKI